MYTQHFLHTTVTSASINTNDITCYVICVHPVASVYGLATACTCTEMVLNVFKSSVLCLCTVGLKGTTCACYIWHILGGLMSNFLHSYS